MADAARELADALATRLDDIGTGDVRTGTVTVASPLTVDVGGGGTPMVLPRLASYTNPAVGDVVLILTSNRAGWTVLGKVVT